MTLHEKIRYVLVSATAILLMLSLMFPSERFQDELSRLLGVVLSVPLLFGFYRLIRTMIERVMSYLGL